MFFGDFVDKQKDIVSLKNVKAEDFKVFLIALAPLAPVVNGRLRRRGPRVMPKPKQNCVQFLVP